MTREEAIQVATAVKENKSRSYVQDAKRLAEYVLSLESGEGKTSSLCPAPGILSTKVYDPDAAERQRIEEAKNVRFEPK